MALVDFLRGRFRRPSSGTALLPLLASRVPADGGPGLVPPADAAAAERERRLGEHVAAELHAYGAQEPAGLARRVAAIADAARRGKARELGEALQGVKPAQIPALVEALEARQDFRREALAATARKLLREAASFELLACALGLLSLAPAEEDRVSLVLAGRSEALAGMAAMALEKLGAGALIELARVSTGIGRALVLERLALVGAETPLEAALAAESLQLAGAVEDPAARAYGAVPLLEVTRPKDLLDGRPELAPAVAACLEAAARGGWNGGPGPGLGRLPGGIAAAEKLLRMDSADIEARKRAARAVLDSHPMPAGPVRKLAQELTSAGGD